MTVPVIHKDIIIRKMDSTRFDNLFITLVDVYCDPNGLNHIEYVMYMYAKQSF